MIGKLFADVVFVLLFLHLFLCELLIFNLFKAFVHLQYVVLLLQLYVIFFPS